MSDINIATSAFWWLFFLWYFFHPFNFKVIVNLNLKCLSCKQHIFWSCFSSSLTISAWWLDCLIHSHLIILLIELDLDLHVPFYFLFSVQSCLFCFSTPHYYFLLHWVNIFFLEKYLFLEIGEGREKERKRNINVWLHFMCPLLGTWPTAQACALTGSRTSDP